MADPFEGVASPWLGRCKECKEKRQPVGQGPGQNEAHELHILECR